MMRVIVIFLAYCTLLNAQMGEECSDASGCKEYQSCSLGYCTCPHGFVKIRKSCYKDRVKHGEECEDDIQCSSDHRLGCGEDKNGRKTCQCNKHFEYDEELKECINARNLTEILHLMQEQWKNYERIENEAKKVFTGLVCAGLLSIVLGIAFAGGCVIYGCCIPRWKMMQFMEEDFQTMPLCPVPHECHTQTMPAEPATPTGVPSSWDGPTNTLNIASQTEAIV